MPLLEILGIALALALIVGYIANRLGFSPVVGYLIAGFIVGPATPGYVADPALIHQLAEAGIIMMMFSVGLNFDIHELMRVRKIAIPGALLQVFGTAFVTYHIAPIFGFTHIEGLILGIGLGITSTIVILKVFTENNLLGTTIGHIGVGWLVMEDILTVIIIALLPTLGLLFSGSGGIDFMGAAQNVGIAVGKLIVLAILVIVLGGKLLPYVLRSIARTRSPELFTLAIITVAFAISVGASSYFGVSMALGAFLGGMAVGRSALSHQADSVILPLKDTFTAIFFVSVGMLFSPQFFIEHYLLVIICLAIILLLKPFFTIIVTAFLGYSAISGITIGIGLAQIGEFSFILAQQAQSEGLITIDVYNVLVVGALIAIALNSILFKRMPCVVEKILMRIPFVWKILNYRADKHLKKSLEHAPAIEGASDKPTAIVVGYGPTGRDIVQVLREKDITPIVIDMNIDTVTTLNSEGVLAICGDASKKAVLTAAEISHADYLISTVPSTENAAAIVTIASSMNTHARILARVRFAQEKGLLLRVGANIVVSEEEEAAHELSKLLFEDLDAHKNIGEGI